MTGSAGEEEVIVVFVARKQFQLDGKTVEPGAVVDVSALAPRRLQVLERTGWVQRDEKVVRAQEPVETARRGRAR